MTEPSPNCAFLFRRADEEARRAAEAPEGPAREAHRAMSDAYFAKVLEALGGDGLEL
jgi:hypothetical protein